MGAAAASVPLCGQTGEEEDAVFTPPVTSSEIERHTEGVEERERKKEAILVPRWHVRFRLSAVFMQKVLS